ncbi:threonine synthase [Desulfobotulus sp. H1]|uniref:Threonine synthase n=1 Tax=Desulfobotulus pelophilus TaxID=2823377 RepID=A0ABT3NBE5_9BACT|nr:threonine synthase [Desulfobotulus pelophilus]
MTPEKFPEHIRDHIIPTPSGEMCYRCLGCTETFGIDKLLYTCPACGEVLLLQDMEQNRLKGLSGQTWREILDYRRMLKIPALKGIYRFHEFIGPVIPLESILYLGEGHTPIVQANETLQEIVGMPFYYKNDGQNPSASFKDRGMASALSYIRYLVTSGKVDNVLAVCASTGDTSAAAALYASYLQPLVKSAVLLPHGKVTPQQLSQPLGNGAAVFEIPGVFDDCMKVVEALSEKYNVALLNSKNAWRILGQESYSYEIAQDLEFDMKNKVVVVPIGNAGNITAVMAGFLKFLDAGIITELPKILGVQSHHANPVYQYYSEPDAKKRRFVPMTVKPSVAQAAMIGNPVSMPRVISLVNQYNKKADCQKVFFVSVPEQEIMDCQLMANRNGHIACTHGGETLAGLIRARKEGLVHSDETAIIDSTAHALKFSGFQEMYFEDRLPEEYEVKPQKSLQNKPVFIRPEGLKEVPAPGMPLTGTAFREFVCQTADAIANNLHLSLRDQ